MTDQLMMLTYSLISDVEDIERYQKGGFYPVKIDDKICGRYLILHKLDYGSYSTVWLARDQQQNRYVALKIATAGSSRDREEAEVLHYFKRKEGLFSGILKLWYPNDDSESKLILKVLGESKIQGNHLCIVTEPLGLILSSMLDRLDNWQPPPNIGRKVAA